MSWTNRFLIVPFVLVWVGQLSFVAANIGGQWPRTNPALSVRMVITRPTTKSSVNLTPTATTATTTSSCPVTEEDNEDDHGLIPLVHNRPPRGGATGDDLGHSPSMGTIPYQKSIEFVVNAVTATLRTVLPPTVAFVRVLVDFYRALPIDAIVAQVGLVYCFCGGSFPTLFAAVQAARVCGWERMISALNDLTEEALVAVAATKEKIQQRATSLRDAFLQTTLVVMKSVDPVKINNACSALYTTWLGISAVLEKEFARTINYAVTLAHYMDPVFRKIVAPPVYLCVPRDYHQWVPISLGWISKALAMRVAWRLQRVLTAGTSAVLGGLMFSRAIVRMLHKRGLHTLGVTEEEETTLLDEILGCMMAAAGIYVQLGDGKFNPRVKFPFTLLTWPFQIAENWIQWQITKT